MREFVVNEVTCSGCGLPSRECHCRHSGGAAVATANFADDGEANDYLPLRSSIVANREPCPQVVQELAHAMGLGQHTSAKDLRSRLTLNAGADECQEFRRELRRRAQGQTVNSFYSDDPDILPLPNTMATIVNAAREGGHVHDNNDEGDNDYLPLPPRTC